MAGQTKEPEKRGWVGSGRGVEGRAMGRYLHDRLSKVLGAPVAQASLEGGADVVSVPARLVTILTGLPSKTAK